MTDLSTIDVSGAKLPSTYHAAKRAISECANLDECKDWSDKAAALASYAKQAQDVQLENMAKRIRSRANRRAGEMMKQFGRPEAGGRPKNGEGNHTVSAMAREAGFSKHQQIQAVRLANIPEDDFEDMVESGATITQMAKVGTEKRQPADTGETKKLMAALRLYSERIGQVDIAAAAAALTISQKAEVRAVVARLDGIHDRLVTSI